MKKTPWSRIRGQNSVYKEFLETVGSGNSTGSVLEETIAVSATISNKRAKMTQSEYVSEFLSCSRMSEKHREPEVPEEEVPVIECLDGLARVTAKELAPIRSVKVAPSRMLVLQDQEWLSVLVKSAHYAHRQVDEQPTKRSKMNDDKSAVALLKKENDWQERESVPDGMSRSNGETRDKEVMRNWYEIHLNVSFLMHDNWVA